MMRGASVLAGLLCVLCAALGAAEPASPDDKAAIGAINDARDIAAAGDALAEAQKRHPNNPKVLDAYLRRAVALGKPQKAFAAAEQLAALQSDHALAQGLLGYCLAMRNSPMEASVATIRAAIIAPDNSGIMFNAGVLAKWKDADPTRAQISPVVAGILQSNLAQWRSRTGFAEGADAADKALALRSQRAMQVQEKIDAAQKKLDALDKPKPLQGKGRKAKPVVDPVEALRAKAAKEQQAAEKQMAAASQAIQKIRTNTPRNADKKTIEGAVAAIQKQQLAYIKAQNARNDAVRRAKAAEAEIAQQQAPLKSAKAAVENLRKEMDRVATAVPVMEWRPPTVDGQAFVDKDSPFAPAAGKGEAASDDGTSKLEAAKALIRNNRPEAAVKILGDIIDRNADSSAATEARTLLDQITQQHK
ncbi:MAG: hypothetical protein ABFD92_11755 [Planctomycetaceae bacterium]|nr:hypothetical protein [Planctomycetaceae bacterium]